MERCVNCFKKFSGEVKIEIINGIHGKYTECPHCKDKNPLIFYDEELSLLVDEVNLKASLSLRQRRHRPQAFCVAKW